MLALNLMYKLKIILLKINLKESSFSGFFKAFRKRIMQFVVRFVISAYQFFCLLSNLYDLSTQIITYVVIVQWIQITFFSTTVDEIIDNKIDENIDHFSEFQNFGKSTLTYQQLQAFLIFCTCWKLLTFFMFPKTTYTFIEILKMASTYFFFFMTLLFLVE